MAGCWQQAYALKYPEHLSHLVLASTFASTKEMNQVLQRIKSQMPKDKLALTNALEKAGLFGKGAAWERGRYPREYATLAWGDGYFPRLYGARPDPNYDPQAQNTSTAWDLYREMWGSHGEFVIDGNLTSVEYLDKLPTIKVPTLILAGRSRRVRSIIVQRDEREDHRIEAGYPAKQRTYGVRGSAEPLEQERGGVCEREIGIKHRPSLASRCLEMRALLACRMPSSASRFRTR